MILEYITAPAKVTFEPAGRWFEALRLRRRHKHSLSHHSLQSSSSEESDDEEIEEEDNTALLQGLDPKEWKVYSTHTAKNYTLYIDFKYKMLITVPCMRTVRFKTQVTAAVRRKSLKLVVTFPWDECHGSPDDLKNTCPCHSRCIHANFSKSP